MFLLLKSWIPNHMTTSQLLAEGFWWHDQYLLRVSKLPHHLRKSTNCYRLYTGEWNSSMSLEWPGNKGGPEMKKQANTKTNLQPLTITCFISYTWCKNIFDSAFGFLHLIKMPWRASGTQKITQQQWFVVVTVKLFLSLCRGNWIGEAPYRVGIPCSVCPSSYRGTCRNNMCFPALQSNYMYWFK